MMCIINCMAYASSIPVYTNLNMITISMRSFRRHRGSRARVSSTLCGFRGERNGVWVGFSRGFSFFPLPQISFHHFSTLISSISFHSISPCDSASGVVGRHPCYSRTYNIGASSHLIPRPDLVLDTS